MRRLALAIVLASCGTIKGLGGDVADESYCQVASCGTVFLCSARDPSGAPVNPELCWVDDSATELQTAMWEAGYTEIACGPTPRGGAFGWPCIYQCPGARGCNAFAGCFCQ